mmetsp:Transcript_9013/g.25122  ORF Transcript_9013/g.25122 Transcript_9013/m.25122 type:complete len:240 (+) Transcript_9013:315-1034(+)
MAMLSSLRSRELLHLAWLPAARTDDRRADPHNASCDLVSSCNAADRGARQQSRLTTVLGAPSICERECLRHWTSRELNPCSRHHALLQRIAVHQAFGTGANLVLVREGPAAAPLLRDLRVRDVAAAELQILQQHLECPSYWAALGKRPRALQGVLGFGQELANSVLACCAQRSSLVEGLDNDQAATVCLDRKIKIAEVLGGPVQDQLMLLLSCPAVQDVNVLHNALQCGPLGGWVGQLR